MAKPYTFPLQDPILGILSVNVFNELESLVKSLGRPFFISGVDEENVMLSVAGAHIKIELHLESDLGPDGEIDSVGIICTFWKNGAYGLDYQVVTLPDKLSKVIEFASASTPILRFYDFLLRIFFNSDSIDITLIKEAQEFVQSDSFLSNFHSSPENRPDFLPLLDSDESLPKIRQTCFSMMHRIREFACFNPALNWVLLTIIGRFNPDVF